MPLAPKRAFSVGVFSLVAAMLAAFPLRAQNKDGQAAISAYYSVFRFGPVADTQLARSLHVRAAIVYTDEDSSLQSGPGDSLRKNSELQLFDHEGQCYTAYRNFGGSFRNDNHWNAKGQFCASTICIRKKNKWVLDEKSSWEYDSFGRHVRSETKGRRDGKMKTTSVISYKFDSSGRKILSVGNYYTNTPWPGLDSTFYFYPDTNTIVSISHSYDITPNGIIFSDSTRLTENYKNGLKISWTEERQLGGNSWTNFTYNKNGQLEKMETNDVQFYRFCTGDPDLQTVSYTIEYNDRSLPEKLTAKCGKHTWQVYFTYLYY